MNRAKDCIGKKFGRLTILKVDHITSRGQSYVLCKCDCGTEKIIKFGSVSTGIIVSCGCRKREVLGLGSITHGQSNTRLYEIWSNMKKRCYYPKYNEYERYGGRGITVCKEWENDFSNFYNWAIRSGYSEKLSIDRIDNDKGYSPENCRWVTSKTQCRNKSNNLLVSYQGETKTLIEWSEEKNISYKKLNARYKRGLRNERLFFNGTLPKPTLKNKQI